MLLRCWPHRKNLKSKLDRSNEGEVDLTNSVCVEKRAMSMSMLIVFLFFFSFFFSTSGALGLTIPPSGTKCVSEEIHNNVVVLGDYAVVTTGNDHSHNSTISVKVSLFAHPFLISFLSCLGSLFKFNTFIHYCFGLNACMLNK